MNTTEKREAIGKAFTKCFEAESFNNRKNNAGTVLYSLQNVIETRELSDPDALPPSAIVKMYYKKIIYSGRAYNKAFLIATLKFFSDRNNTPKSLLVLSFYSFSKNRFMEDCCLMIKTPSGKSFSFKGKDIGPINNESDKGGISKDVANLHLDIDLAEQALIDGSEVTYTFDNVTIKGILRLPCVCPAALYRVMLAGDNVAESDVDTVYGKYASEVESLVGSRNNKEKAHEIVKMVDQKKAMIELRKYEKHLGPIKEGNYCHVEDLLNENGKITDYLNNDDCPSELREYVRNIPKEFNLGEIKRDIQIFRDKEDKQNRFLKLAWLRYVVLFVSFSSVLGIINGFMAYPEYLTGCTIAFVISLIIYFYMTIRRKSKVVFEGELKRFADSFNGYFAKYVKARDNDILKLDEEIKQKKSDFPWYYTSLEDFILK